MTPPYPCPASVEGISLSPAEWFKIGFPNFPYALRLNATPAAIVHLSRFVSSFLRNSKIQFSVLDL